MCPKLPGLWVFINGDTKALFLLDSEFRGMGDHLFNFPSHTGYRVSARMNGCYMTNNISLNIAWTRRPDIILSFILITECKKYNSTNCVAVGGSVVY